MANKFETPKGFRDFLPEAAKARALVLEKLKKIIERFGFEPLETPAVEFAETLKGKYGEEEKLIFEFSDRGGRAVALRYDQTVPLARIVASYANLPKPFKRYQFQPVWRADNPQKGRFREFLQVDFDIVGEDSLLADAEILATAIVATKEIGFKDFVVKINDRETFRGLSPEIIRSIDKIEKIGEVGVIEQLLRQGYDRVQAKSLLKRLKDSPPTPAVKELFSFLEEYKIERDKYAYDPTLARGLDYYTGIIFEIQVEGYEGGSIGGGGRYDKLIGRFTSDTPAVGFSFGFDRLLEAAEAENLLPAYQSNSKVLVAIFEEKLLVESLSLVSKLRNQGIAAEISLDPKEKLEKQLKYADSKKIPFVAILGPDEIKSETISLKNMTSGEQTSLKMSELLRKLTI